MNLNADFDQRVVVHSEKTEWLASPMPGVERRMLDRVGGEVARATSIVRYAPGSRFSSHVHTGGEEFIVLDGVFQDEHGDFPAGAYIRNPPESSHTPGSESGCVIFVKLWQFDLSDRTPIVTNIHKIGAVSDSTRPGVTVTPLFEDERENVRIEHWAPGVEMTIDAGGGAEVLVLDGTFTERGDVLAQYSWLRLPIGYQPHFVSGENGARVWIKSGGLRYVAAPGQVWL